MRFFRRFLNCCAGFRFYRTLLPLHPLESVKFLAGVVLLVVAIQVGTFIPVLWGWMQRGADWVEQNLPRFEIRQGQAHYPGPEPFVFTNEYLRIVLDTSGETNEPPYIRPWGLFVGRDKIQYGIAYQDRQGNLGPPRKNYESLKDYPDGVVDGTYVRKLASPWIWRIAPYAVVLYFFGWLLLVLIQAYLFTLVISFAESATLRKFGFNEFFNIAAHACAPAAIVVTTLIVARTPHMDWLLMAFLATYFIYILGATAACRRSEDGEKDSDEAG